MNVMVTQIATPALSPCMIQRPRMARLASAHSDFKLVFISAAPGYGKTTLASTLANTARARGTKCAWVTLGRHDNDPKRFWLLVTASLESSFKALSFSKQSATLDNSAYDVIASVVNQVAQQAHTNIMLAIDNFQFISSPELNEQISTLIENAPSNLTIIIVSDCAPTFPIAALQVEGRAIKIDADDLRFRIDETEYFLNGLCQLDLSSKEVKTIHRITRGWPAGLQMANTILASGKSDAEAIIAIEDMRSAFFIDAVVSRKSEEMQSFLLRISHLPRISPLLAEYVTESPHAGALLAELEHDELFAAVSHDSPPWYAFSKAFRNALHQHALETLRPADIRLLHQRASEWFEKHGEPMLAIEFALKAHRPDRAADIIADNTPAVLAQSQGEALVNYLKQMNLEERLGAGKAGIIMAWAYCAAGKPRQALRLIELARSVEHEDDPLSLMMLDIIDARANSLFGNFERAVSQAERAFASVNALGQTTAISWLLITIRHTLGESYAHLGKFNLAIDHLSYSLDMAVDSSRTVIYYLAACELSELLAELGRWNDAVAIARTALQLKHEKLAEEPWSLALVQLQLSTLLLFGGMADEAEDMAMRAKRRLASQANADGTLCLLLFEGRLAAARGDRKNTSRKLSEAVHFAQEHAIPRGKGSVVCAEAIMLLMCTGSLSVANSSLEFLLESTDRNDPYAMVLSEMTCATAALFNGMLDEALVRTENVLKKSGRYRFLIVTAQALIVQALCLSAMKDIRGAINTLLDAAKALEPNGITFPIVAVGSRMGALIEMTLSHCASASHAFQQEKSAEIAFLKRCASLIPGKDISSAALSDTHLTPREQQIFQLLQMGKSRREISSELAISYNTVRVHVSNIYKKMKIGDEVETSTGT